MRSLAITPTWWWWPPPTTATSRPSSRTRPVGHNGYAGRAILNHADLRYLTSQVPRDERFQKGYDYMGGTSQATPFVSALAALLFSAHRLGLAAGQAALKSMWSIFRPRTPRWPKGLPWQRAHRRLPGAECLHRRRAHGHAATRKHARRAPARPTAEPAAAPLTPNAARRRHPRHSDTGAARNFGRDLLLIAGVMAARHGAADRAGAVCAVPPAARAHAWSRPGQPGLPRRLTRRQPTSLLRRRCISLPRRLCRHGARCA